MGTARGQRYVTRASVVRAYYGLRAAADAAAQSAQDCRDPESHLYCPEDEPFHSGRQAGMLVAMTELSNLLREG